MSSARLATLDVMTRRLLVAAFQNLVLAGLIMIAYGLDWPWSLYAAPLP